MRIPLSLPLRLPLPLPLRLPPAAAVRRAVMKSAVGLVVPTLVMAQIGVQRERNKPDVYAITNAHIVPVSSPAIDRGTVVIRNGRIAAVGASVPVPADARTIDG